MQKGSSKIDPQRPVTNVSSLINLVKTVKQNGQSIKKNKDQSISQPEKMLNTRTQSPLAQHKRFEPLSVKYNDEMDTEMQANPLAPAEKKLIQPRKQNHNHQ